MKGKKHFTKPEIEELKRLIILRNKTAPTGQKSIRQRMRNIGLFGKDDWGITDMQLRDLESLIKTKRITVGNAVDKPIKEQDSISVKPNKPKAKTSSATKFTKLKKQLEAARLKYKPDIVKYLLIAEAPPDSLERFFYYDNVHEHDYLFLGVARALYPDMKDEFLARNRSSIIKNKILTKLKNEGFYLLDLSELPLSLLTEGLSLQLPSLIEKVKIVAGKQTRIILIKVNVYDIAYNPLQEEFGNVVDIRITFPGQGGQTKFQNQFLHALKEVKYL